MKRRRRRVIVDSAVQWTLVRRVLCHWACFLAVTALLLPFWMGVASGDILNASFGFRELLGRGLVRIVPVMIFFLAIAPPIAYDILKLSHRFVGPVHRLHKAIQALAAGEATPPVKLRKDDFWHEVMADFNVLAEQVAAMRKQAATTAPLPPVACAMPEMDGHRNTA